MAAYIANTLDVGTAVAITGGAAAAVVVPANAANVMIKLYSPTPAFWGGSGADANNGFPFQGETDWIPTSVAVYVYSDTDVSIRWMKGT